MQRKTLDWNYTRTLSAVLTESWKQYHTNQQLYSYLPHITRKAGHCWGIRTNPKATFFPGLQHMNMAVFADQQGLNWHQFCEVIRSGLECLPGTLDVRDGC